MRSLFLSFLFHIGSSPVSFEACNAVVCQRVFHGIHEYLERNGSNVSACECALGDVLRLSDGSSNDLCIDVVDFKDFRDGRMSSTPSQPMSSMRPTNGLTKDAPARAASSAWLAEKTRVTFVRMPSFFRPLTAFMPSGRIPVL